MQKARIETTSPKLYVAEEIVWETSFKNALALAKKTNKLVLASFFDPCCESCAKLKASTLTAGCVRERARAFYRDKV